MGQEWVGVIGGPWGLEQGLITIFQIWKLRPNESRLRNAWSSQSLLPLGPGELGIFLGWVMGTGGWTKDL